VFIATKKYIKVLAMSFPSVIDSPSLSKCVGVEDADFDDKKFLIFFHMPFGFVSASFTAFSTYLRFASLIFVTTQFRTALYDVQSDLSRDFNTLLQPAFKIIYFVIALLFSNNSYMVSEIVITNMLYK
jgi:hypothetical protein